MAKIITEEEIQKGLGKLTGWERQGASIQREFKFQNFAEALKFVNRVGKLAEAMDHHPDIFLHGYKFATLTLTTHQATAADGSPASGLTRMDFDLAQRIDEAFEAGKSSKS